MGGKRLGGKARRAPKRVVQGAAPARDRRLVWRFGRLDYETQFGCQKLLREDVRDLEVELAVFQQEAIPDLIQKRWLKLVPVNEMTPDGQRELAKVSVHEEGLWQLHLQRDKWRIWGFFEDPEFHFVWWDGDHGVATGKSRYRRA